MKQLTKILQEFLYDRSEMPQIEDIPEAVKQMKERGIDVKKEKMCPCDMKPSQTTLDLDKCESISKSIDPKKMTPIVVSLDDHIVDGHHRWKGLEMAGYGNTKITVYRINMNRRLAIQTYKEME